MVTEDTFPAGLRVMVVDDDPICLLILDRMLRRCSYQVTTCGKAIDALEMLRGHRDEYDLVISDVCMPDMDGFKLLELVGLEMDLPVIMMSANGETSAVMRGIKHGACDYLLKPVRIEELKNIWQHVVRKKWRASQQSICMEDIKVRKVSNESTLISSASEGADESLKESRKRKDIKDEPDDVDHDIDDSSGAKKSRVVWSVELHQQFVAAVNYLGIDKAVPKRILELMNVQGLTRENIASHLQKYRLYLRRISSAVRHRGGLLHPFEPSVQGSLNPSFGVVSEGRSGSLSDLCSQALMSSLQSGLLGTLDVKASGAGDVDAIMQIAALQGGTGRPQYNQMNLASLQAQPLDLRGLVQSSPVPSFPQFSVNLPVSQMNNYFESAAGFECKGQLVGPSPSVSVYGSCIDKGPYITTANVSAQVGTPKPNTEVSAECIRRITASESVESPHSFGNLSSTSILSAGQGQWLEPVVLQRSQAGWQGVGDCLDFDHMYAPRKLIQPLSSSCRGLPMGGSGQAHGQLHSPYFSTSCEGGDIMMASMGMSPLPNAIGLVSRITDIKEEGLDGTRAPQITLSSLSDDLIKILLKQHTEMGFTDG